MPGRSDPSVRAFVATSVRLYEALVQQPIIVRRGFTKVSSIVSSSADLVSNVRTFMSSLDLGAAPQEPCLGTDAFASRSFGTLARIKRIAGAEARLVSKSEAVAAHEAEEAETARGTTVLIKTGPHAGEQGVIGQQNKTNGQCWIHVLTKGVLIRLRRHDLEPTISDGASASGGASAIGASASGGASAIGASASGASASGAASASGESASGDSVFDVENQPECKLPRSETLELLNGTVLDAITAAKRCNVSIGNGQSSFIAREKAVTDRLAETGLVIDGLPAEGKGSLKALLSSVMKREKKTAHGHQTYNVRASQVRLRLWYATQRAPS